ncbi:glycerophosphodiester phosphodiesterase [Streptomyces sp. NBC_01795]|uniref:glycerophosphodiester phosphodiesterase n=1 Tax=unclassified Streptomyces TaxID=2593676 RepID=UPI002DD97B5D|nr:MULTISPECIES: glycerophosphodiester phosphodiesterase [unclassified Streptomyces]WSA93730.1 glycerophosphodiester phosphodiesterase [Streptomyces sp. NBC_01795]WSB78102.1 glycerophosphodiester phosphodiesterase [Streptomyces sp. NBC_01775]WSS13646.1 glycerophosphodiester phosphodiesterase [Streptomyces sp. NBC_01186]
MSYEIDAGSRRRLARPLSVIAHRGASMEAPEHTLAAYRRAIEEGADGLECDVRLTADGHLVCVHDRRVNRTSNGRGAVSTLELADLAALDFGSWKGRHADPYESPDTDTDTDAGPSSGTHVTARPDTGTGTVNGNGAAARAADPAEHTSVLTLDRLLRLVAEAPRPVELAIETKHPTRWAGHVEERLLELLARHRLSTPVRVMSFSARSLQRVRTAAPHLPTVYLMQLLLPRHRDGRLPHGVRIAGPSIRILRSHPGYVARAHRAGNEVHVWTVDEPEDVELCVRLGVDAIITNRPHQVRSQLGLD